MKFEVVSKRSGYVYEVYAVDDLKFLIYLNDEFQWVQMSLFRPKELTHREKESEDYPLFKSQLRERKYP